MSTTVRLAFPLVALALIAGACSEPETRPLPSPTSAFLPETGPAVTGPSPTGATAATGGTGDPGGEAGELTRGRITMQISGEVEAEATLDQMVSAVYSPPPGALAIVWASGTDANVVGLGGTSFVGDRPTSPTLTLTITAQTGGDIASFVSVDGECEISILVAERDRLFGSFTCAGLTSSTGRVANVSASFEAAR